MKARNKNFIIKLNILISYRFIKIICINYIKNSFILNTIA